MIYSYTFAGETFSISQKPNGYYRVALFVDGARVVIGTAIDLETARQIIFQQLRAMGYKPSYIKEEDLTKGEEQ